MVKARRAKARLRRGFRRAPTGALLRQGAVAAALLGSALGAWAQSLPTRPPAIDLEELRRQEARERSRVTAEQRMLERERALRQQQEAPVDARPQAEAPATTALLPDSESPCFRIERLTLGGEDARQFEWLLDAADGHAADLQDSPIGRCIGTGGVNIVLARLQHALIARGWITTRVLAAPQDLSGGTLALTLVPGLVTAIRLADPAGDPTSLRAAIPARAGELLNLRDIEQGLENLKRLPTAEADIQVEPSQATDAKPGDSDLVVKYQKKSPPLRATLSLDDSGTEANPAGIQVDGGGFINASRATLTTGAPQFNTAGSLESFLVRGGTVTVEGTGLDASKTDYAAILARAVQVNAGRRATRAWPSNNASPASYEAVAQARGSTYFSMSDWSAVQGQLGADKMWEINKAFLDQQIAQGRSFIFTEDPALSRLESYTRLEFNHLKDAGYSVQPTAEGIYRAIKE